MGVGEITGPPTHIPLATQPKELRTHKALFSWKIQGGCKNVTLGQRPHAASMRGIGHASSSLTGGTGLRRPGRPNVLTLHNATPPLGLDCRQLFTFISENSHQCLLEIQGQEFLHI